jgi:hypothetical protein
MVACVLFWVKIGYFKFLILWYNVEYCGVFTPCKNCISETRFCDYATADKAVFSPCCAVPSCAVNVATQC